MRSCFRFDVGKKSWSKFKSFNRLGDVIGCANIKAVLLIFNKTTR